MQALAHANRAGAGVHARATARRLVRRRAGGDARTQAAPPVTPVTPVTPVAPVTSLAVFLKPSSLMTKSAFASSSGTSPLKGYGMHVRLRLPVPAAGLAASWGQISSAYTRSRCSRSPLTSLHGAQALAEAAAGSAQARPQAAGAQEPAADLRAMPGQASCGTSGWQT